MILGILLLVGAVIVGIVRLVTELPTTRAAVVCPHCGVSGHVTSERKNVKRGLHGGKATAGFFTGGLSLALTGLSRQQRVNIMRCGHCGMTWTVE